MSIPVIVGLAAAVWFPAFFAFTSARAGGRGGATDRAALASNFVAALVAVVAAHALMPWHVVPEALWGALVALAVFGGLTGATAWRRLPRLSGTHPRWRAINTAITVFLGAAALVLFMGP